MLDELDVRMPNLCTIVTSFGACEDISGYDIIGSLADLSEGRSHPPLRLAPYDNVKAQVEHCFDDVIWRPEALKDVKMLRNILKSQARSQTKGHVWKLVSEGVLTPLGHYYSETAVSYLPISRYSHH